MKLMLCAWIVAMAQAGEPATAPAGDASELVNAVMKASGADVWPKVTRIKFTFQVDRPDKPGNPIRHDWDVRKGTDTVTWNGKTVTVNLYSVGDSPDEKEAFKRWTNDTYWLLMPLKLKDGGATVRRMPATQIDGKPHEVLHVSFKGVGLTPDDQYNLYIDPQTHLVSSWDYMPKPDTKRHMTWGGYKPFNGLTLSTEHDMGDGKLRMSDIEVTTE